MLFLNAAIHEHCSQINMSRPFLSLHPLFWLILVHNMFDRLVLLRYHIVRQRLDHYLHDVVLFPYALVDHRVE